jgi:hypothetical protein
MPPEIVGFLLKIVRIVCWWPWIFESSIAPLLFSSPPFQRIPPPVNWERNHESNFEKLLQNWKQIGVKIFD